MGKGADTLRLALTAGETIRVAASGNSITVYDAAAIDLAVYADNVEDLGVYKGVERGVTIDTSGEFSLLQITSATTQVIVLVTSFGEVKDRRFALPGSALPTEVNSTVLPVGGTLNEIADGAAPVAVGAGLCVSVAAANAARKNLIIRNTGAAAVCLRSDNTAATSAFEIGAGQSAYIEMAAEAFIFNPSAASVNIQVSEIA